MGGIKKCCWQYSECNEDRQGSQRYCKYHRPLMVRSQRYGITPVEVEKMLEKEDCDICGKLMVGAKEPQIDHCHRTGRARGVLCSSCNRGLARFNDNSELISKAHEYLIYHANKR